MTKCTGENGIFGIIVVNNLQNGQILMLMVIQCDTAAPFLIVIRNRLVCVEIHFKCGHEIKN